MTTAPRAYNVGVMAHDPFDPGVIAGQLYCPHCGYLLVGLREPRCPECGHRLDEDARLQSALRRRPPRFTGAERPLPDFGLDCKQCGELLVGAPEDACPHCTAPFDLRALPPSSVWFRLASLDLHGLTLVALQPLLWEEEIPYLTQEGKSLRHHYGGGTLAITDITVPTEFYFDVLHLLRTQELRRQSAGDTEWQCLHCHEMSPATFDICWNCERPRP